MKEDAADQLEDSLVVEDDINRFKQGRCALHLRTAIIVDRLLERMAVRAYSHACKLAPDKIFGVCPQAILTIAAADPTIAASGR